MVICQKVVHLSDLQAIYVSHLAKTPFPNPNYRGEKLKTKLEKCEEFQDLIDFCPMRREPCGRFSSFLVYNVKTDIKEAMMSAYGLGQKDKILEVAELIRSEILKKFHTTDEMPWPVTVSDLNLSSSVLPEILEKFLTHLLTGGKSPSCRIIRIVSSATSKILSF